MKRRADAHRLGSTRFSTRLETGHEIAHRALKRPFGDGRSRWRAAGGRNSERGDRSKPAAPFIPPVWYRARPWDPPITNDAAWL
ncbi:hypothetical protein GCM10010443_20540 [Actinoplanes cyaneus]